MTVRRLYDSHDEATWTAAIAALPSPLTQDTILEDQEGATYTETVSLVSRSMGGFTLTLRQKTGVAKPIIQASTDNQGTVLVSNTVGVVLDGLSIKNGASAAGRCLSVGTDSGGGAAGVITLTVQNCDFNGTNAGEFQERLIYATGWGSNVLDLTVNDCTFAGTWDELLTIDGTAAANVLSMNRCTSTAVNVGAGRIFRGLNGTLTATFTRCNLRCTIGAVNPLQFSPTSRNITATLENCVFWGDMGGPYQFSGNGGSTYVIRHCTFLNTHDGGGQVFKYISASGTDSLLFKNNIIADVSSDSAGHTLYWLADAGSLAATTSDYNLFYLVHPTGNFVGISDGTSRATLANWQAGTGLDTNSLSGSPSFTSISTGDVHIPMGSLAAGAGTNLSVALDLDGTARPNPPAIGAYEPPPIEVTDAGGIASSAAVGSPTIGPGVFDAGGIASSAALGSPTLDLAVFGAGGIASSAAVGTPTVLAPTALVVIPTHGRRRTSCALALTMTGVSAVDTTRDDALAANSIDAAKWTATGTARPGPGGVMLDAGVGTALLTSTATWQYFDAQVLVADAQGAAGATLAALELVVSGVTYYVRLRRLTGQAPGLCTAEASSGGAASATAVELGSAGVTLRLVRGEGAVWAWAGGTALLAAAPTPLGSGTLRLAVRGTAGVPARGRWRGFTARSAGCIDGRLLEDVDAVSPRRVLGLVPDAPAEVAGLVSAEVFGPWGRVALPSIFTYDEDDKLRVGLSNNQLLSWRRAGRAPT